MLAYSRAGVLDASLSSSTSSSMLSTVRRSLPQTLRSRAPVSRVQTAAISSISRSTGPLSQLRSLRPSAPVPFQPATSFVRTMSAAAESAVRPDPDQVLQDIADYVHDFKIESPLAFETARLCLIDTIGCGLEALRFPACSNLLGPVVEGTVVPNGACTRSTRSPSASNHPFHRHEGSRNELPARPYSGRVQHRYPDPVAGLQRLFPCC